MVNHLVFQGRTTRDMEKRSTQGGVSVVSFTLAWNEKYKEIENKCFLRCKAWRGTADFLDRWFHDKGSEVVVEGWLGTDEWDDKDGNHRSETILNVEEVHFCGKRNGGDNSQNAAQADGGLTSARDNEPLPF